MNSLNPVHRIGDQIVEAILAHTDMGRHEAAERAVSLFEGVGLQADLTRSLPPRVQRRHALALDPSLIIMGEPTPTAVGPGSPGVWVAVAQGRLAGLTVANHLKLAGAHTLNEVPDSAAREVELARASSLPLFPDVKLGRAQLAAAWEASAGSRQRSA